MGTGKNALDLMTGTFYFDKPSVTIMPTLTTDDLQPWAEHGIEKVTQNPPWLLLGYRRFMIGSEAFAGLICFKDGAIQNISLMSTRPEFGTSWNDFSHEKEEARQAFHNQWLAEQVDKRKGLLTLDEPFKTWEWDFNWGKIVSGWDTKNGTTEIVIVYAKEESP